MRMLLLVVAGALASCGQAQPTGAAAPAGPGGTSAAAYTVAGLTTGMTQAQVKAVMAKAGYALRGTERGRTFAEEVAFARGEGRFGDFHGIGEEHWGKGAGETVSITYVAMPGAPVAAFVAYMVQPGVVGGREVMAEMTRRFGPSAWTGRGRTVWCASGSKTCESAEPSLAVDPGPPFASVIIQDPLVRRRQADAVRAAPGAQKSTM